MVMQNKKDLEELKELIAGQKTIVRDSEIPVFRESEMTPSIEIPTRDTEDILPVEESSLRMDEVEKEQIRRALEASGGNRKVAADMLGRSERTLYRKIKEYGL
jgi:DNA-binding NtrC family response regulator